MPRPAHRRRRLKDGRLNASALRLRAWSTRMRRINCAETAKKWAAGDFAFADGKAFLDGIAINRAAAEDLALPSAVLTFDPPPPKVATRGIRVEDSKRGGKIISLDTGPFKNGIWIKKALKGNALLADLGVAYDPELGTATLTGMLPEPRLRRAAVRQLDHVAHHERPRQRAARPEVGAQQRVECRRSRACRVAHPPRCAATQGRYSTWRLLGLPPRSASLY